MARWKENRKWMEIIGDKKIKVEYKKLKKISKQKMKYRILRKYRIKGGRDGKCKTIGVVEMEQKDDSW